MPFFFDYHHLIVNSLINKGYRVSLYELNNINTKDLENIRLINLQSSFNYVLCLGKSNELVLSSLRKILTSAYFVFYNWDDLSSIPSVVEIYKYFDKCCTYSLYDSQNDSNLKFIPFFYLIKKDEEKKYDVSFVGTWHSKRINKLNEINSKYPMLNTYFRLYKPMAYYLLKPKYMQYFFNGLLSVKKIDYVKLIDIFSLSKCVLDLPSPHQKTPTTRVIESLATNTKIISTCKEIKDYEYYDPENIQIIDSFGDMDISWINKPFKRMQKDILNNYSLDRWIDKVLS